MNKEVDHPTINLPKIDSLPLHVIRQVIVSTVANLELKPSKDIYVPPNHHISISFIWMCPIYTDNNFMPKTIPLPRKPPMPFS